jgi:hypothetical protein
MAEYDYKQRPSTREYRDNWDKVFQPRPRSVDAPSAVEVPSNQGPESPANAVDGSGLPTSKSTCIKCGGLSFNRLGGFYVCNECGDVR